ncbi:transposase [Proteiniclasticum sp. QWL-01]|uniref:IS1634 family transposase n=4 Tax=Proteiniclasticum sp. QWL-01 TaxID=3036945 RepID=UPI00241158C0|nr:transposase [Proteiniclasticum sp. QWL-01]WFF73326.1 transposase [Proteiniclasticum sp. QWL-01]
MAMLNISIPIPTERITYKKDGPDKPRRVYHVEKRYRNALGTPTAKEVAIGKEDPTRPGWMIPNERFTEFYPLPVDAISLTPPQEVLAAGHIALLWQRAEAIGLTKALQQVFPLQAQELLAMAIYMVCEGNVMMNLDLFIRESLLSTRLSLNSQRSSELFAQISEEQRFRFFKLWSAFHKDEEQTLAYDVTSISTYAEIQMAEYGYNRDQETLPQLNIGMLYGTKTALPLCYEIYSGSIVDKAFFPYMMELGELVGLNDLFYIMDRGFLTLDNLSFMAQNQLNFLMAAPKSQKIYRQALIEATAVIRHSRYHIPQTSCYGLSKVIQINELPYTLHIYLNTSSAADEEARIYQHVDRLEEELQNQMKPISITRYNKYYDVTRNASPIEEYERNHEKITEMIELAGMFCLLSNTQDKSAEEALRLYGRRDTVEKAFQNLKNSIDYDRFLTHTEKTTEGKAFVAFLSLILWSDLTNHGKNSGEKSINRVVKQMGTIKRTDYGSGCSLLQPLTRKQKDILSAFAIEPEEFLQTILHFEV